MTNRRSPSASDRNRDRSLTCLWMHSSASSTAAMGSSSGCANATLEGEQELNDPWTPEEEEQTLNDFSIMSRRFDQVFGLVPGGLDAPTVMSMIVLGAFILQFYWTVTSSSTSGATTTTAAPQPVTTVAAAQIYSFQQTVTPASAPFWRSFLQDFDPPPLVNRRSLEEEQSAQEESTHPPPLPPPPPPPQGPDVPRPRMSLEYHRPRDGPRSARAIWDPETPKALSSHRLFQGDSGGPPTLNALLLQAERWSDKMKEWRLVSPDGSEVLTQTLLLMRCAMGSNKFCAKLDHYYRRQHDLNLAAAMMNLHSERSPGHHGPSTSSSSEGDAVLDRTDHRAPDPWREQGQGTAMAGRRAHEEPKDKFAPPPPPSPPRFEVSEYENFVEDEPDSLGPGHRPRGDHATALLERTEGEEASLDGGDGDRRVLDLQGGRRSWDIYSFMSVMAVIVFLLDASYRILRLANPSARVGEEPLVDIHELFGRMAAAIRRFEGIDEGPL